MSERDALMAAVVAEPDADAPRLVYADWLEEYPRHEADTARSHFIRLEIEAEQLASDTQRRSELERQAAVLFNKHHHTWNAEIPTWNEWYDSVLVYRRGFPYELRTVFRKLAYSNELLFQVIPIQSLTLTTKVGYVHYSRHQVMTTWQPPSPTAERLPESMPSLFAGDPNDCRHDLSRILKLQIGPDVRIHTGLAEGANDAGAGVFRMVTSYPSLRNLEELGFPANDIVDDYLFSLDRELRSAVFASTLRILDLSDNRITDAGASVWAATGTLEGLEKLVLTGNPISTSTKKMLKNRFGNRVVV